MNMLRDIPFRTMSDSPLARFESAVAAVNDRMFVIGGHMEPDLVATAANYAYSPSEDRWSRCADAPRPLSHLTAAVVDDRYIWLVGGYEGQHPGVGIKASFRYDTVDDRWEDGPPLPSVRASGGLAPVGRLLHYFGGLAADRSTNTDDHWVLDVDRPDAWRRLAPIPFARTHAATAVIGRHIYAIGGHFGHDVPGHPGLVGPDLDLDYVHRYDADEDTWTEVAPLRRRRSHCEPGTFVKDGRIVCIGGRNNAPTARCRCEHSLLAHYGNRLKRKVRIKLGMMRAGDTLDDVIGYDPETDRWTDLGRLPQQLYAPAATVVGDTVVVTNGGGRSWQEPSSRTFALDL